MQLVESLSAKYLSLSDLACEKQKEFERLLELEGTRRELNQLQNELLEAEMEMRETRREILENCHATLSFWERWSIPRYWEVCCPIKVGYEACSALPWYDHISRRWYESEWEALVGAYRFLKLKRADRVPSVRPLVKMIKKLIKDGDVSPEVLTENVGPQMALPAPATVPATR